MAKHELKERFLKSVLDPSVLLFKNAVRTLFFSDALGRKKKVNAGNPATVSQMWPTQVIDRINGLE